MLQTKQLMSLLFDDLVQDLKQRCIKIAEKYPIADNATLTIDNILMCGFALFSIKDNSLAKFVKKLKERAGNLKSIFKITQTPSDTAMRTILDEVPTSEIQNLFIPYVKKLEEQGVLSDYEILGNLYIPLDGTRHHSSQNVYCDCCLTTHHRNGTTTYHHDAICACIVHPNQKEVFPIGIEEIIRQDGQTKNDCETNAAKRLIPRIVEHVPTTQLCLGGDAIYATGPMIRLTQEQAKIHHKEVHFIFSVQPGSHQYLFLQFERLEASGNIKSFTFTTKDKKYVTKFANELIINGKNADLFVNFLYFEEHDLKKGTVKIFSWITDIPITTKNYNQLVKLGRSRWKIENETFNTLKNQGYEFEHNFGHGHQFLAANFAVLMLLAFLFDQIQQRVNLNFKLAKLKAGSRIALWEKVRQYFDLLPIPSMDFIYQLIIGKIKFKVQFKT